MNVFCPYSEPIMVARCLDPKRLNRQIQEARIILNTINRDGKLSHPIMKMYKGHEDWLFCYYMCLKSFIKRSLNDSIIWSLNSTLVMPSFLTKEFCDQHKRRLYTKNEEYYKQFAEYGKSEENWYFVGDEIVKYINGKRIN